MGEEPKDLAPWEVPPDEAYWHALLNEEEPGASFISFTNEQNRNSEPETHSVPSEAATATADTQEPYLEPGEEEPGCWDVFSGNQAEGCPIELEVIGFNRGGLLVKWLGVSGFVPASQLCGSLPYDDEQSRRESLAARVGSTLILQVIDLDPSKKRLILSERVARRQEDPDPAILDQLDAGDVRQGRVTNLCAFGAFVELGGVEGLVHISELSWGRVSHPSDVLQRGQEVEVYILNIDRALRRVGLSLKRLQPDPWETVESRYQIGQTVEGTVTNVVSFGAFVRLEQGLEGLLHASELASSASDHQPHVQEGDSVQVRIISIEAARHRIGLSLQLV